MSLRKRKHNPPEAQVVCSSSQTAEAVSSGDLDASDDNPVSSHPDQSSLAEPPEGFNLKELPTVLTLPPQVKDLYPHQKEGLRWLWSLHRRGTGGILADDMGLGKTRQVCSFLAGLLYKDHITHALIVVPATLIPDWKKELITVMKLPTGVFHIRKTRKEALELVQQQEKIVVLTTYDLVSRLTKDLKNHGKEIKWDYLILDEGHLIKNPDTVRFKALSAIQCSHPLLITGTPIQNDLQELWTLFSFSCPGILPDKISFKEEYQDPILSAIVKNASQKEKEQGTEASNALSKTIRPYLMRRLKSKVFQDFPDKYEIVVWLRLTDAQRTLYTDFRTEKVELGPSTNLPAMTVMRKICDDPHLFITSTDEDNNTKKLEEKTHMKQKVESEIDRILPRYRRDNSLLSCKMACILFLLQKTPKKHFLIFSTSKKMLDMIGKYLKKASIGYLQIDGETQIEQRQRLVKEYQEGDGPERVFLLTSKVGGLGLTLTRAHRVILFDPSWNPSMDNQSVDRAYRIGQKKDVIVYRLITSGTIEETVYKKQIHKGRLAKAATMSDNDYQIESGFFDSEELKDVFCISNDYDVSSTQARLDKDVKELEMKLNEDLKEELELLQSEGMVAGITYHNAVVLTEEESESNPFIEEDVIVTFEAENLEKERIAKEISDIDKEISRHSGHYRRYGPALPDKGKNILDYIEKLKEKRKNYEDGF